MNNRRVVRALSAVFAIGFAAATTALHAQASMPAVPVACRITSPDTLDANFVPAGLGSLRIDDISISITLIGGLQVKATPLEERVLRLLAPDAYKSYCQNRASKRVQIDSITRTNRLAKYSLWFVQYYGVEQGEVRFSPREFVIKNVGRDFRPLGVIPLSSGFGDYRVKQQEVQTAIFVFDGQLDINQPIVAQIQAAQSNTDWNQVVRRLDQERALVRSRAASRTP